MMRLTRTAALSVTVLFASVVTASAECAWVLWANAGHGWSPEEGFATQETCATKIKEVFNTAMKHPYSFENPEKGGYMGSENTLTYQPGKGAMRSTMFRCLPDTVDPRAPKDAR